MEHIVKTYILLLFSLLVSSIGYAQEENDIIYIQHTYLQPIITQYFIDNKSEIWLLFLIAHSKR